MKKAQGYRTDRATDLPDFVGKSMKDDVKDLLSAHYYATLTDGSTDSSIIEPEVLYVLFLSPSSGLPVLKFLNVKSPEHAHADGLKTCTEDSFYRIGITPLHTRLASLNIDGAAVNTGIHSGLGVKFKEYAPWRSLVHYFNHRLEMAVKDTFDNTFFMDIDTMLLKPYYLYRKSPKRSRELNFFSEMYENTKPKPYKFYRTCWIYHKLWKLCYVIMEF